MPRHPDESESAYLRRLDHDLRGPLNAIVLSARALEALAQAGEPTGRLVGAILRQSERLARTLDGIREPALATGESDTAAEWEPSGPQPADEVEPIAVLLVEDNPQDADVIHHELDQAGARHLVVTHAGRLDAALAQVAAAHFDVVLLDLFLPDSQGLETVARAQAAAPNLAIVVLSGLGDRRTAMHAVRQGAQDYLIKGQVTGPLLVRAVEYALERKRAAREREDLIAQLQEALNTVKRLSGLLPICASCKKIRKVGGEWQQIEEYLHEHSEADFSHGLCPTCAARLYPEAFP